MAPLPLLLCSLLPLSQLNGHQDALWWWSVTLQREGGGLFNSMKSRALPWNLPPNPDRWSFEQHKCHPSPPLIILTPPKQVDLGEATGTCFYEEAWHDISLQPWCKPGWCGWCDVFDHMSRNGVSKCCMKLIPVDFYIQNCNIKAGIARSTSILPVAAAVQIAPDIFYGQNLPFILRQYWTDYKYNINVISILRCTFEASFAYHKYGCTFNNLVCGIFVFGCDRFVI